MAQMNFNPGAYVPDMSFIATAGAQVAQGVQQVGAAVEKNNKIKATTAELQKAHSVQAMLVREQLEALGVPKEEAVAKINEAFIPPTKTEAQDPTLYINRIGMISKNLLEQAQARRGKMQQEAIATASQPVVTPPTLDYNDFGSADPSIPPTTTPMTSQQDVYNNIPLATRTSLGIIPDDVGKNSFLPKTSQDVAMDAAKLNLTNSEAEKNRRPPAPEVTTVPTLSPNTLADIKAQADRQADEHAFKQATMDYNASIDAVASKEKELANFIAANGSEAQAGEYYPQEALTKLQNELDALKGQKEFNYMKLRPGSYRGVDGSTQAATGTATQDIPDSKALSLAVARVMENAKKQGWADVNGRQVAAADLTSDDLTSIAKKALGM